MLLEADFVWTSAGSSGGLEPVYLASGAIESVLKIQYSTIATTNSISFQTGQSSAGPWINEATATLSTAGDSTAASIRVTGPYTWMRPYLHTGSSGTYVLRLVAVS